MKIIKVSYTLKLDPSDRDRLIELSKESGKKPRTIAREAIERYLDSQTAQAA